MHNVTILPENLKIAAEAGEDLLSVQIRAGLVPDAPCGGQGTCGKCLVDIVHEDGSIETVKACKYSVQKDLTIRVEKKDGFKILASGIRRKIALEPQIKEGYGAAFDIGTTTVVCYLLNLATGAQLGKASMLNPQRQFGADVISRCEHAIENGIGELTSCIRDAVNQLLEEACRDASTEAFTITTDQVRLITVVGNTCMHHLFMGIDPKSLTVIPYNAAVTDEIVMKAGEAGICAHQDAILQVLPNIAGFVGADTVGCLLATEFDSLDELTLLVDIGTNGEMVMGNRHHMLACSTAAGPAFEAARVTCGRRGVNGSIDHVKFDGEKLVCHVIGSENGPIEALGICGSGLLDALAACLDAELIDETGTIDTDADCVFELPDSELAAIRLTDKVFLSQKDVYELQLAKSAIAAGIELLAEDLEIEITDLKKVLIAGAFGNYMDPHSACRIGMIPNELEDRIEMIGNAAGEGSVIATLNYQEFLHAQEIRDRAEFLELASHPDFQDAFVDHLMFGEL